MPIYYLYSMKLYQVFTTGYITVRPVLFALTKIDSCSSVLYKMYKMQIARVKSARLSCPCDDFIQVKRCPSPSVQAPKRRAAEYNIPTSYTVSSSVRVSSERDILVLKTSSQVTTTTVTTVDPHTLARAVLFCARVLSPGLCIVDYDALSVAVRVQPNLTDDDRFFFRLTKPIVPDLFKTFFFYALFSVYKTFMQQVL